MLIRTWGEVFSTSLQNLWTGFISFVPNLVVAIIVFIAGWVIGSVIGKIVAQIISALKVDSLLKSVGAEEVLDKAGIKLSTGGFIGGLVKWFIIVVFLMTSLEVLHLTQVNDFLRTVVLGYLPQVIIAALILVVASVVSSAMSHIVMGSAKAANVRSANFLGTLTRYAIWIFAFIIALDSLGIAQAYMQVLFTGVVGMLALAGGLALGLGGKDTAANYLNKLKGDISHNM